MKKLSCLFAAMAFAVMAVCCLDSCKKEEPSAKALSPEQIAGKWKCLSADLSKLSGYSSDQLITEGDVLGLWRNFTCTLEKDGLSSDGSWYFNGGHNIVISVLWLELTFYVETLTDSYFVAYLEPNGKRAMYYFERIF
ncbi:MAG: hypothetical protein J5699_04320 [Bacteroidales bacterium]|nr:hypothetical protein [Bacteroidales bacterium]